MYDVGGVVPRRMLPSPSLFSHPSSIYHGRRVSSFNHQLKKTAIINCPACFVIACFIISFPSVLELGCIKLRESVIINESLNEEL